MSVQITIKGTIIEYPSSAASPNWAPALIEFAQAVEEAINSIAGTFDVAPQVQNIDTNNPSTNIDITNLTFPISQVRAATIFYTVYRKTEDSGPPDGQEVSEEGTLEILYNASNPATEKWHMIRAGQGDAFINFDITDSGQITFTTTALTGISHTGIVAFRAIAVLNE